MKGSVITKPGNSNLTKTGAWSVIVPSINREKCIGCTICLKFCPEHIISHDDERKAVVNFEYCKGCGICAHECPVKAIVMEGKEEEK